MTNLFDAPAFALRVRLAMAEDNLSYREAEKVSGVDQSAIFRVAKKGLAPSVETYLRLVRWLDARTPIGDPS